MRLTLRTLLAYRDRVLKSSELEDMHARVQQSAMAGNLLKRIEALSRRANILAPPIDGKGLGADANSIAEYLDDALKGEKVPELERICLESDVQLAELTQCHHLLSTALSTSVDIPPALRERILALGNRDQREKALAARAGGLAALTGSAAAAGAVTPASPEGKSRFRTDPSHAPRNNGSDTASHETVDIRPAAADSAERETRAKRLVTAQPVEAPMVASGGDSIRPTGLDLEGPHLAHEVPEYLRGRSHDGWTAPLAIGALVAVLFLLVWQSIGSWSTVQEMFASRPAPPTNTQPPADASGGAASNATTSGNNSSSKSDRATASAVIANATPNAPASSISKSDTLTEGADFPSAELERAATTDANASTAGNAAVPGSTTTNDGQLVNGDVPATSTGPARPAEMSGPHAAQWLPSDAKAMQSMIFVQTNSGAPLHRLQAAERLPGGSHLFVPLANRPMLDLVKGPHWLVCGPSHLAVSLPDAGADSIPSVDLFLGRSVLSAGTSGPSVIIRTPDSQVLLSLTNAAARVAIEQSYVPVAHGPMTDRSANAPLLFVSLLQGTASIQLLGNTGGDSLGLALGQTLLVGRGQVLRTQNSEIPLWVDSTADRPVDQLAAEDMHRQLSDREPTSVSLQKLATNRRPETRALAAQTLALLGNWDWIVADKNTLSDTRDRSYWSPLLDMTRQAIAAHPENANVLRNVLIAQDANSGAFRADMWIGLTQAQLTSDGLARLVDLLDSENLLDRILAIYQLQRLTGKDLGYQASDINRASIQQWNRELASGRVQLVPLIPLP